MPVLYLMLLLHLAVARKLLKASIAHAKSGGQCNKSLMERAVVVLALPHPLVSPSTIRTIGELYAGGNRKLGVQKHNSPTFFDVRGRAAQKYDVSKVADRLKAETAQCHFLL